MSGISIDIGAKDAGFTSTIDKINRSMNGMDRNTKKVSSNVQNSLSSLKAVGAGLAGVTAAVGAFTAVTVASQKILSEYAAYDSLIRSLKTMDGTAEATAARLERLRAVAMLPGLGFEEAIKGDIRLRAAGISAELAERSLRSVGNALAAAGGGKSELDGVILALGQIASKGKVSAEEINQIAERLPQVRVAMKAAFGTADTEAIQKMGISATEFITGLVQELEKLPAVTGGAQNMLDNYGDSWKALKTQAAEFGTEMAGGWLERVTMSFDTARKLLLKLKEELGMKTQGLEGGAGKTEEERIAEKEADKKAEIDNKSAEEAARAHNANILFWQDKEKERTEFLRSEAEKRVEIEKDANERTFAAQEDVYESMLSPEDNIKRKMKSLEASGPSTVDDINKTKDPVVKAEIAERLAKIVSLKTELGELERKSIEDQVRELNILNDKQEVINENVTNLNAELEALDLRRSGQTEMAKELIKENDLRKEAIQLAEAVNISEKEALGILKKKVAIAEETRLVAGGLSLRTQDRAEKRALAKQTRIEDFRLKRGVNKQTRINKDDLIDKANIEEIVKKRHDEMKPGAQGKTKEEVKKDKEIAGITKPPENPMDAIKTAVEEIKKLVAKIEPKLPTVALAN